MNSLPVGPVNLPITIAYNPDCDPKLRILKPGLIICPIKLIYPCSHDPYYIINLDTI